MIETEISILINRKSDIDLVKKIIIDRKIQFPIYLFEYEKHFKLIFTSDYEEWELDTKLLDSFPGYEFTSDLQKGRKEIRIQVSRNQSELSTDDWGRQIENPIKETKYLIRKSKKQLEIFNPSVKVLFEDYERNYYINILKGVDKNSGEKGFLLLNEFKTNKRDMETEVFKDRLYSTPIEAFQFGYYKMQYLVSQDFKYFENNKKKEVRKRQRLPRKLIRDFIKSSNNQDIEKILKNLDENVIFQKKINWRTEFEVLGKKELKKYFESPNQEFCGRELKIRSTWNFDKSIITIEVKYFLTTPDDNQEHKNTQQYRRIKFELKENVILRIIEEK